MKRDREEEGSVTWRIRWDPTGIVKAATLQGENEWMKRGWRKRMNGKGMAISKEVWHSVSAGHPTGIVEVATLYAVGDREKEWMK